MSARMLLSGWALSLVSLVALGDEPVAPPPVEPPAVEAPPQPAPAQPLLSSAKQLPGSISTVIELTDLATVLDEFEKVLTQGVKIDPRMERDFLEGYATTKAVLGGDPLNAEQLRDLGLDISKPITLAFTEFDESQSPQAAVLSFTANNVQEVVRVFERIATKLEGKLNRAPRNPDGRIERYELTSQNGPPEFAVAIDENQVYLIFGPNRGETPKLAMLDQYMASARQRSLSEDRRFEPTLSGLTAPGELSGFVNIKGIVDRLPLRDTPAILNEFSGAAWVAGNDQLQATVLLSKYAGLSKYLKPGSTSRELLGQADPPLAAFTFSLDDPLGLLKYIMINTEPRAIRDLQMFEKRFGMSFEDASELFKQGAGGVALYPGTAPQQPVDAMVFLKVNDKEKAGQLVEKLMASRSVGPSDEAVPATPLEEGTEPEKVEPEPQEPSQPEPPKTDRRRDNPPTGKVLFQDEPEHAHEHEREGELAREVITRTYGPNTVWITEGRAPFAVAIIGDYAVMGNAVTQIHNLARGEGDGWEPQCGGNELGAGEILLGSIVNSLLERSGSKLDPASRAAIQNSVGPEAKLNLKLEASEQHLLLSATSENFDFGPGGSRLTVLPVWLAVIEGARAERQFREMSEELEKGTPDDHAIPDEYAPDENPQPRKEPRNPSPGDRNRDVPQEETPAPEAPRNPATPSAPDKFEDKYIPEGTTTEEAPKIRKEVEPLPPCPEDESVPGAPEDRPARETPGNMNDSTPLPANPTPDPELPPRDPEEHQRGEFKGGPEDLNPDRKVPAPTPRAKTDRKNEGGPSQP